MIKNIIFDVGGVLANPKTGHWFITPNFWNILDKCLVDEKVLKKNLKKNINFKNKKPSVKKKNMKDIESIIK